MQKRISSTLVGRMKVSAELDTRRKALKNTGSSTAWYGTRSDEGFQLLSESGSKKREHQRRRGSGKEGILEQPLKESQRKKDHYRMEKWESEKHKSRGIPAEGFKGHVATDDSLLGTVGKW